MANLATNFLSFSKIRQQFFISKNENRQQSFISKNENDSLKKSQTDECDGLTITADEEKSKTTARLTFWLLPTTVLAR